MKRFFLIVGIALGIAVVALAIVLWRNRGSQPATNTGNTNTVVSNVNEAPPPTVQESEALKERGVATALAVLFTERYGSYSSETLGTNVDELASFMTDRVKGTAQNYVRQEQARLARAPATVSVVTKALSPTLTAFQSGRTASFSVGVQREEQIRGEQAVITRPTLLLLLVKQGDQWKVDEATWREAP